MLFVGEMPLKYTQYAGPYCVRQSGERVWSLEERQDLLELYRDKRGRELEVSKLFVQRVLSLIDCKVVVTNKNIYINREHFIHQIEF